MNRITIADASKVTPQQFARHILGPSTDDMADALAAMSEEDFEAEYARARAEGDADAIRWLFGEKFRRECAKHKIVEDTAPDTGWPRVAA